MNLFIGGGWLKETATIEHKLSPNYNDRPASTESLSLLVIHHISLPPNRFGGKDIIDFFCNQLDVRKHPFYKKIESMQVSAHVLIKRNGAIVQFVNFNARAWHAGESSYQGRKNCNDFSIGIELEGDTQEPFRYAQYQVLQKLTSALQSTYPAIANNITGHENIAPGRKSDPGPTFEWSRYL